MGDIPPMETMLNPPEAVAKIAATPETDNLRSCERTRARASSPLVSNRSNAGAHRRTLNTVRTSRRRVEPSPRNGRRACVLRRPRTSSVRTRRTTSHPHSRPSQLAGYVQGCAVAPHSVRLLPGPPSRYSDRRECTVCTRSAEVAGDAGEVVAESSPSKCLIY